MKSRTLLPHPDYDPATQRLLGYWAAQLDDQVRVLRHVVDGLGVAELERLPTPGHNSIGMLLAHLAIVETWWLQAVVDGVTRHTDAEADAAIRGILGIGMADDGLPLEPDGGHPDALRGFDLEAYLALIDRARRATHRRLRSWLDSDLEETAIVEDTRVSRSWIVYHVLEHLACHLGQIRLKRRQFREADGRSRA
jgi:uncharacterized damage-inducible protein DinB